MEVNSMTPSSTPQPSISPKRPPQPTGRGWGFLVFIFRLLLLGVGGSLAALAGIAIAQYRPSTQTQEPPLVEKVVQGSRSLWTELTQIPTTLGLAPPTASPSPVASASPESDNPSPAAPQLSQADRQKLQAELTQLQSELDKLRNQPQISEDDRAKQAAVLEERMRALQQQLNPTAFIEPPASPQSSIVPPATSRVSGSDTLMVTLPTDALFSNNETTLRLGSEAILDSILSDLQRYPGATIRVHAHTDSQGSEAEDRARTFEQATAIEQYLSSKLGEDYHWAVAGYGHTQPLSEDNSPVNRQRNRRIELVIQPK
jgi:OmpA-OmpF porin, OOP family